MTIEPRTDVTEPKARGASWKQWRRERSFFALYVTFVVVTTLAVQALHALLLWSVS